MELPISKERLTEHLASTWHSHTREIIKLASSQNSVSLSYCLPEPSNFMALSFISGLPQQKHTRAISEKSWGKNIQRNIHVHAEKCITWRKWGLFKRS